VLVLTTSRLLYTPIPLTVMRRRLRECDFDAELPLGDGREPGTAVRFPAEWPGDDALWALPRWISRREAGTSAEPWTDGMVIDRRARLAVGSMGFLGPPNEDGAVEIGYATNRSLRGRGYASEMAGALSAWALGQPGVRRVIAACLAANLPSIRVLERSGFTPRGERLSDEGPLLLWERRPEADPGG
jgi:RimJ/RimL family protein N-acetyltransferase